MHKPQLKQRRVCSKSPSIVEILDTVLKSLEQHGGGLTAMGSLEDRLFLQGIEAQLKVARAQAKKANRDDPAFDPQAA